MKFTAIIRFQKSRYGVEQVPNENAIQQKSYEGQLSARVTLRKSDENSGNILITGILSSSSIIQGHSITNCSVFFLQRLPIDESLCN